jgi:hypothetical protein
LALAEAQRRDARTRARPTLDARRGGVPLGAVDPDEAAGPLLEADPPVPELVDGAVVPEDPAERAGERATVVVVVGDGDGDGGEGVGGGTGTGTETVGTGTGTVGVGSVGTVTVGRVGGAGGSRASAGATSMAPAATAQQRIGEAFRIRLYNPDRPPAVTPSDASKSANCSLRCGPPRRGLRCRSRSRRA